MYSKGYWHCKAASLLGRLAGGRGGQKLNGRYCGLNVGNGGLGWVHVVSRWLDGVDVGDDALGVHNSR